MWVVKLGGSLASAPQLKAWLTALSVRDDVVLVPGGGPFADQVRTAHRQWGFDDASAHHMALLGMEQYGWMLCALESGLRPAANPPEIRDALAQGKTPVWMPVPMVVDEPEVGHNWDVTSDSLAAWLCHRLEADGLLLVKSAPPASLEGGIEALAGWGILDAAFPRYAERLKAPIRLLSRDDLALLEGTLDSAGTAYQAGYGR
jgi:5-(aminomethyl)-3-furanmethanol phosphate kinase